MSTYVCSDFHGCLHFYKEIKKILKSEDKVFFLGDAGDRGPHCWETIKAILDDPQFIYIRGNHEDMLIRALEGYLYDGLSEYRDMHMLSINGGGPTYEEAIADPKVNDYYKKLIKLPLLKEYFNPEGKRFLLSHAGFTPWKEEFFADDEEKRDVVFTRPSPRELVWNRDHFFDVWDEQDCVDCYIIHGHTPIPYLLDDIDPACKMGEIEPGALWYDNDRKCCVDCGAVFTGICVLLNLDTLEEEIFISDPYIS